MFLKSFIVFWREIKSDFKMNDSFDRITELCGYVLYRFVYSLVTVCIHIQEKNAHARLF